MTESLNIGGLIELIGSPAGFVPSALPGAVGAAYGLGGAADTWDLGAPQPVVDTLAALLGDGEIPLGRRASNRTMSLPVVIRAPDLATLTGAREALFAIVDQETWTLSWTRDLATAFPVTFDCFRANPTTITYSLEDADALLCRVLLSFQALPYARSASNTQTLNFASSVTGGTPPPAAVTIDSFSSVSSSTQASWWASKPQAVIGAASAYWDWDHTDQDSAPLYTHTLAANVNITGRTKLSLWVGLGAPDDYDDWHKGNVSFAFTLSDSTGHKLSFGTTSYVVASNSGTLPQWNQVTCSIPQGTAGFDYTHIHAYSVQCWSFTGEDGDLELKADTWLNGVQAVASTTGSPASSRGTVYQLAGIIGSAHALMALQFQQPAGAAGVNWLTGMDATFEGGLGDWIAGSNCTITDSPATSHVGSYSCALTSAAAGNMNAVSFPAGSITTLGMPVTPATTVTGLVYFQAAASARSVNAGIDFYTSGGAFVSTIHGSNVTDATTGWVQATVTATVPATSAYARLAPQVVSTGAGGEVHYIDDPALVQGTTIGFTTLIAHMPSPQAPAALVPLVQAGNGADPPDNREYAIPAAATGVNARFGGAYTVVLTAQSFANTSTARTVTVTVHQYEFPGGPVATASVARTFTPSTDITNNIVIMDNLTLPVKALPPDNSSAYFTVSVNDPTQTSDRFLDLLFIDTQGQVMYVSIGDGNAYNNYWLDVPSASQDLGLLSASTYDRSSAVSVMQYAIISGGPLVASPGANPLLAYSVQGQPALQVVYQPRYWADDPGGPGST